MKNYSTQDKIIWAVRILLWLGMLIFGLMKLGAPAEMQSFVGNAGHSLFPFLSADIRFWIATIWEIIAWLWLLSGIKGGAILTIIIMLFALNATWFADPKAWLFLVAALAVIVFKWWAWRCCTNKKCCGDKDWNCKDGSCSTEKK